MAATVTIGQHLNFLRPRLAARRSPPRWPPDVFAVAASLLLHSGAYLQILESWPPAGGQTRGCLKVPAEFWCKKMRSLGESWRGAWPGRPPEEICRWWRILYDHRDMAVAKLSMRGGRKVLAVRCALLQLCATADEASKGAGTPVPKSEMDLFKLNADALLWFQEDSVGSTLCQEIDSSRARVLPKFHTPQTGITVRSLSHHIALWPSTAVRAWWGMAPEEVEEPGRHDPHPLSLLLVPWPEEISAARFSPLPARRAKLRNLPRPYEHFDYDKGRIPRPKTLLKDLQRIYAKALAVRDTDRIDMVVLPELALHPSEYRILVRWVVGQGSVFVAGVNKPGSGTGPGMNCVKIAVPISDWRYVEFTQPKHHRWQLDGGQIRQYGLEHRLDPEQLWWEHAKVSARGLAFVTTSPWMCVCALICEDLARQDPLARLVRAVGPNLVIALLMDGPQLAKRWSARYATVLADDPGSSVLTLTSIGMAQLSRPLGRRLRKAPPSRAVALWKEPKGKLRSISLPVGAAAVLLSLNVHRVEEWAADGRSDGMLASYPTYRRMKPIFV